MAFPQKKQTLPASQERRRFQRVKVHLLGRYMLPDRRVAAQLTWLANRDILNLPEDRRHDRIVPRNPIAMLTLEDGTKMTCRIIDMSLSGAAIAAENRPPLKSMVMLGKVQARVVRNLEEGFALEFVHEQMAETLEESVTAR